jgi:hypothetical protein
LSAFIWLSERDDLAVNASISLTQTDGTPVASNSAFPITNLQTSDITELWKSSTLTGNISLGLPVLSYLLNIDLGASLSPPTAQTWDEVVLINHDFARTTTLFHLYSGTTPVLGSMTDRGVFTWREFDMYIKLAVPSSHRFLKIWFGSSITWTASMGRIMVALSNFSLAKPKLGWSISMVTKQTDNRSAFNVKHVDTFCQYRQFSFTFIPTVKSPSEHFMEFLIALQGMRYWFFLIPDSTEYHGYVVRQMSQPRRIRDFYEQIDEVQCEEESRGVRISA